jgi:hypothetical protein
MRNFLLLLFFLPFFSFSQTNSHFTLTCARKGNSMDSLVSYTSHFVFDAKYVKYTHHKKDTTYKVAELRYNNALGEYTYYIRKGELFYYYPKTGSIMYQNNYKPTIYDQCVIVH